ncbi:MAG: hypothetical protein AMS21_01000 [Gemmatimonas sp. SG8_38_2]|nr:MAG: hypothetical protein AMS21_01000 [Gemmatimonas sp. SG8_38_2]
MSDTMSLEDRDRLFKLKCRSKSGGRLSKEEHAFCIKMQRQFKDEYRDIEREVFVATAPFGSYVGSKGRRE